MVELSHVVTAGMVTFPGLPGPRSPRPGEESRAHYAPGTEFEIGRISMVGNTGTYLDSPYHRYPEGADLAGLPLDALADLPAVVVRVTGSGSRGIGAGALAALDVTGCAVLLHTGWDRFFGTPAYSDPAPYLTAEGARWLVDHGARLVGIDSINIDDPVEGGERPAHSTPAGRRHPGRGASLRPGAAPAHWRPLHRRPPADRRLHHLPGPRLRRGAAVAPVPTSCSGPVAARGGDLAGGEHALPALRARRARPRAQAFR